MSDYKEQWQVDACIHYMESGFNKGICLDSSSMAGALGEFESALNFLPDCKPILECCAMLKFMLDEKVAAREYHIRGSRNQHCFVPKPVDVVHKYVWIEFMKWIIYGHPLMGKHMEVKYEMTLPALPSPFQSSSREPQVFKGEFHFSLAILRIADNVELTLTLEHAEIGVSNFMKKRDFQGYFIYTYDIDVSPSNNWQSLSELSTVRPVVGQTPQLVQQQVTNGYIAQVGIGGTTAIPNFNFAYKSSQATSSFESTEAMTASKGVPGNDNAMRITWKVNTYEKGKPFMVKAHRKIRKLPYPPTKHVCNDSVKFQGKWVLPLVIASGLQYEFEWMITLTAKFALLPRKRLIKPTPEPLIYEYAPSSTMEMSDFYSASTARMFQF